MQTNILAYITHILFFLRLMIFHSWLWNFNAGFVVQTFFFSKKKILNCCYGLRLHIRVLSKVTGNTYDSLVYSLVGNYGMSLCIHSPPLCSYGNNRRRQLIQDFEPHVPPSSERQRISMNDNLRNHSVTNDETQNVRCHLVVF